MCRIRGSVTEVHLLASRVDENEDVKELHRVQPSGETLQLKAVGAVSVPLAWWSGSPCTRGRNAGRRGELRIVASNKTGPAMHGKIAGPALKPNGSQGGQPGLVSSTVHSQCRDWLSYRLAYDGSYVGHEQACLPLLQPNNSVHL